MNWNEVVEKGELIYKSKAQDEVFRNWSLKETQCEVTYYETYPLTDLDNVICSLLRDNSNTMGELAMATILGFNVVDNFDVEPKRYKDDAELQIFRSLVKQVSDYGLVCNKDGILSLTPLGERALSANEKYKFFKGKKILFENNGVKESDNETLFPFYSALGICSEICDCNEYDYTKVNYALMDNAPSVLTQKMLLQSSENYKIIESEETRYFAIKSNKIDITIYNYENTNYPIIFYKNIVSKEATDLLNNNLNASLKEKKIEWGLYLRLMNDRNAVLDFDAVSPFEDILELDNLIVDDRLVWSDDKLFDLITRDLDANQWSKVSERCPLDVIKSHLDAFKDNWDWIVLSKRIDGQFLATNAVAYPWDFELVSHREDIDIETIKFLILIPELRDSEWDWDAIMPQLDIDYIKANIRNVDFDFYSFTKDESEYTKELIVSYPNKKWDWAYVSKEYDLDFIYNNINALCMENGAFISDRLSVSTLINRIFVSEEFATLFSKSEVFASILSSYKQISYQNYNDAKFVWSDDVIALFEKTGLINWTSQRYVDGFECNPNVTWNSAYFDKYSDKVTTAKGFDFVSSNITDSSIVSSNLQFNWNWETLSANVNVFSDNTFITVNLNRLSLPVLLIKIDGSVIETLFEECDLSDKLENYTELWNLVTEKVSIDYVRKHIDYAWDWTVLTKRFYKSIKVQNLGNSRWKDKWDWNFLTENLEEKDVEQNLSLYADKWNWNYISESFDTQFIIGNISTYSDYWNWEVVLKRFKSSDLNNVDLLMEIAKCLSSTDMVLEYWKIITKKFTCNELYELIKQTQDRQKDLCKWDYEYLYNMPKFNIRDYIQTNEKYVSWKDLSCSKSLNEALRFDKDIVAMEMWIEETKNFLSKYDWDFKELSKCSSINSESKILDAYKSKWDWDYLSEFSGWFKKTKRIDRYEDYLNYSLYSRRTDTDVDLKYIESKIDKNWDWSVLSSKESIKLSIGFVEQYKDKNWDWKFLSRRKDIAIDNDVLYRLSDKDWDLDFIIQYKELSFNEKFIEYFSNKTLDWKKVSMNSSFVPNAHTLSLLKGKALDWEAISQSKALDKSVLWDYQDKLNWKLVTVNKSFDITDDSLLTKYQDKVDWDYVSGSEDFVISEYNLEKYGDYVNWNIVNSRNFKITNRILEKFADKIDWTRASRSQDIDFSSELIGRYKDRWNWKELSENSIVKSQFSDAIKLYHPNKLKGVEFVSRFNGNPYIYHFTHLFNAVEIIKNLKILSRNKAEGLFSNSAGNLVDRRSTAHNFARFYYRTQTPTQFYNECLGKDCSDYYYNGAKTLGLPKCPMPVFFKFDLEEVMSQMLEKCYYSTGNMQTNWAQVIKVTDNPYELNTDKVYCSISDSLDDYKRYSQQEFLVEGEFDFSKLSNYQIFCYDDRQAETLRGLVGNTIAADKITSKSSGVYQRHNKKLSIVENETTISISTDYRSGEDTAFFRIRGMADILSGRVVRQSLNEIIIESNFIIQKSINNFEIYFADIFRGELKEWLIYKN